MERRRTTLTDKINWLMGVRFEDTNVAYSRKEIVCRNFDCADRGQYTNCYSSGVDDCYLHTLWKKRLQHKR